MHRLSRHVARAAAVVLFALLVAACAPAGPSPSPSTPVAPSESPTSSAGATGPRPVVIDTDLGQDDLLAIYALLREPAVDVRAIAISGTGLVHCGPGLRTMRRLLVAFDRVDIGFGCGRDRPGQNGRAFPDAWRAGADDMYGVVLPPVVGTDTPPDAVTLLRDAIAGAASPVTIVELGPWSNLEDLIADDPGVLARVERIHAMGGALDVEGNVELGDTRPEHRVEWNLGADPDALAAVLATDTPVTFVPLDATNDVPVPADVLARLQSDHAAAGADIAFETYARTPFLSSPGQFLWDALAAVTLVDPTLARWEEMPIGVTVDGPEAGRIRRDASGRTALVAIGADGDRSFSALLDALRRGAPRPEPFTLAGTLRVTWDGTACTIAEAPVQGGPALVVLENHSTGPVGLIGAGMLAPHTWEELVRLVRSMDLSAPVTPPAWVLPVTGLPDAAAPGAVATSVASFPSPLAGVMCATGEWPDLVFHDGGAFVLAE